MRESRFKEIECIGVDVDDVLADFVSRFKTLSIAHTGKPEDYWTDPVDWEFSNFGYSPDEFKFLWWVVASTDNFWLSLDKLPYTSQLTKMRFHPIFITSRLQTKGDSTELQTATWLREKFGIEYPTVLRSDNKGELAKILGLRAFIDDKVENCEAVRIHAPDCRVYLKDRSHNKDFYHEKIQRVDSFDAFIYQEERYD